ncbi:MAG: hypothetical protein P1P72_11230 [ANME-2 cluster archaeon]|nr:hypothetical protein [ANME-2 cluster archaeon]
MAALHHQQLNLTTHHYHPITTTQSPHPKPARRIEKRHPAPITTRAGGADREGHPGKVKEIRGRLVI